MVNGEQCCIIFIVVVFIALIIVAGTTCSQFKSPQCFVDCFKASNETIKQQIMGGKKFTQLNHSEDVSKHLKKIHESNKPGLIALLADWCGYCKKLKESGLLKDIAKEYHVLVLNDKHPQTNFMMGAANSEGFPTLLIFHKGQIKKYDGPRDTMSVRSAMRKME